MRQKIVILSVIMIITGNFYSVCMESPSGGFNIFDAVRAGDVETLEALLRSGINRDAQDAEGWSPLHYAVSVNNLESVRLLVESGASTNVTDEWRRCSPITYCCFYRRTGYF